MTLRRRWDIHTRTQLISLGPALLLTLLLTGFFTFARLQDLRQELNHTGQLIASQLAPAAEHGVVTGNLGVLESLLQASLDTPHVRFLEVRDRADNILVYLEQQESLENSGTQVEIFHAPIIQQQTHPQARRTDAGNDGRRNDSAYLGRVVVGMSNDAFSSRQQTKHNASVITALITPPNTRSPSAWPVNPYRKPSIIWKKGLKWLIVTNVSGRRPMG